jgi:purine-binding chemotaxis protein CheW
VNETPLLRALQSAPDKTPPAKPPPEQEFFCFKLGELRLGVPSENVREVIRSGPLTPLPRMAAFVMGVVGHRGEVLPVLDLLRFLGKGESRITARTRLFVGVCGTFNAAVVADGVIGLRTIGLSRIIPAPMGGDASTEHLLGVVDPGRSDRSISLIDFQKVMNSARQRAVSR